MDDNIETMYHDLTLAALAHLVVDTPIMFQWQMWRMMKSGVRSKSLRLLATCPLGAARKSVHVECYQIKANITHMNIYIYM